MNDYNTAICIVGICLVITALVILINHLRTKKTIDTIENMLNEAVKGNFSEKSFDETRLSSLETRFAHYLSASVVSARNVELEKDKIIVDCGYFPPDQNSNSQSDLIQRVIA